MNRTQESIDEVGGRVGTLLRERSDAVAAPTIQMERVVAGANRRRRRSRIGASALCVCLVVGGGYLVTQRIPQPEPTQQPVVEDRPVLDRYAVLDGLEPQAAFARAAGALWTVAQPRVDVWADQSRRLVIRTMVEPTDEVQTDATIDVRTTTGQVNGAGPWADRIVDRVQVRGVAGAVEQLAGDQFSVWVPTAVAGRYTQVISRGFGRQATLAAVEEMTEIDAVLQPVGSLIRVEHAEPVPFSAPSSAYAQLNYGASGNQDGPWVATFEASQDRVSLELALWSSTGRVVTIEGREVLLSDEYGRSSASWLDDNAVVTVWQSLPHVEELIPSVRMVREAEFLRLADDISDRIVATTSAGNSVSFGRLTVSHRAGNRGTAVCLAAYGKLSCVSEQRPEEPEIENMHVEIDGHWLMFGYREIGDQDPATIRSDELRFESPDGVPCVVHVTEADGGYWYVVEVPDGLDVVTTNVGDIFGGPVGDITRPQVASVY